MFWEGRAGCIDDEVVCHLVSQRKSGRNEKLLVKWISSHFRDGGPFSSAVYFSIFRKCMLTQPIKSELMVN